MGGGFLLLAGLHSRMGPVLKLERICGDVEKAGGVETFQRSTVFFVSIEVLEYLWDVAYIALGVEGHFQGDYRCVLVISAM